MKTIRDVELKDKRVLCRVDFNVPLDENQTISDDTRIRFALPTLKYIQQQKAKLVVASHLGRPQGKIVPEMSLAPVARRLGELLSREVKMATDCIGFEVENMISKMDVGDILLLENLRFHPEEQDNDAKFAKALAELGDIYVNDAFAVSHRAEASVVGITQYAKISTAGFLLQQELAEFEKALSNPKRPLVAVLGGAKVSSKLEAIENMLQQVDKMIIGGVMANTFLKSQGYPVGNSKIEAGLIEAAGLILNKAAERNIKFYLPVDVVVSDKFDPKAQTAKVPVREIPDDWIVMDVGPATSLLYGEVLHDAQTIVWNGPLGVFEMEAFSRGTMTMAHDVAGSKARTIVGGGDTLSALHAAGEAHRISYLSTGGGAFLALLGGRTLPAVAALRPQK